MPLTKVTAQKYAQQLDTIKAIITTQENDSSTLNLLNNLIDNAKADKDTITLIKSYDLYAEIFKDDTTNGILKRFLLQKSLLLKTYYYAHPTDTSLAHNLYYTYKKLALLYEKTKEIYTAIDLYYRMVFIAQQINEPKLEAQANNLIANAYYYGNNFEKSLNFYNKSLKIAQAINDSADIVENLFFIGLINYNSGAYSNALSYFYEAQNIASQIEKNEYRIILNIYIAKIFYDLNNWEQAEEYSSKAIFILKSLSKDEIAPLDIGLSNMVSGLTQYKLKNYSKALEFFITALKYFINTKATTFIVRNEAYIGLTYMHLEKYEDAKQYLTKSYLLAQKTGKSSDILEASIAYAKYHLLINETSKAKAILLQALPIAQKSNAKPKISEITDILYNIYKKEQNYKQALFYLEYFLNITGEIHRENALINLEKIKVEQQYKENSAIMQEKVELMNQQRQNLIFFIVGLSILLLLIILLSFFFFRKIKLFLDKKS